MRIQPDNDEPECPECGDLLTFEADVDVDDNGAPYISGHSATCPTCDLCQWCEAPMTDTAPRVCTDKNCESHPHNHIETNALP